MQQPSIFTRIINGEIPAHKIYEDDRVIAFLEVHPLNEGHTLVVPKKQVDHIWDLSDDDYDYLWKVVKKIASHIREVIKPPRVGVIVEGFGVPHAHVHLIPIYHGDDLKRVQNQTQPSNDDLAKVAQRLKM
jgi:histidine triad (HIT) family protein